MCAYKREFTVEAEAVATRILLVVIKVTLHSRQISFEKGDIFLQIGNFMFVCFLLKINCFVDILGNSLQDGVGNESDEFFYEGVCSDYLFELIL